MVIGISIAPYEIVNVDVLTEEFVSVIPTQALKANEDAHVLRAETSSQLSVDLKFARSLVRVSEIQANVQEER